MKTREEIETVVQKHFTDFHEALKENGVFLQSVSIGNNAAYVVVICQNNDGEQLRLNLDAKTVKVTTVNFIDP